MAFTKLNRYEHRVIEVCMLLSGSLSGTGDSLSDKELSHYLKWLKWRISDKGWLRSKKIIWSIIDDSVRKLAHSVLQAYKLAKR